MFLFTLTVLLYRMDRLARPVVAVTLRTMAVWKWLRGKPEEVTVMTLADLEILAQGPCGFVASDYTLDQAGYRLGPSRAQVLLDTFRTLLFPR